MSSRLRVHELPLLSSGLPEAMEEWLRLAGVPVVPFGSARVRDRSAGESSARLLLYDSRHPDACTDARLAHDRGLRVLDTAAIWEEGASPTSPSRNQRLIRSRIIERLKTEIERIGGTWLRIADYPFPYQSAACFGTKGAEQHLRRLAAAFEPLPARFAEAAPVACRRVSDSTYVVDSATEVGTVARDASTANDIESWIRRRYSQGLPLAVLGPVPAFDGDLPFDARRLPLLWRTSFEEFATWWRQRAATTFRASLKGHLIQIECESDFGDFPPMLELWRGQHIASIPLRPGMMTVREDGLVFQQEHNRHPAGFAPIWTETESPATYKLKSQLRSA